MCAQNVACPVCSKQIVDGVAYFSFGASADLCLLERKGLTDAILGGFCHIGYHGADPEVRDSVDYCVARDIEGGQMDISFCSLGCLREWFRGILDNLECELAKKRAAFQKEE